MKLNKVTEVFGKSLTNFKEGTKKNSPAILTGLAVVGLLSTVVLAYKAAPKAEKIMEKKKKDMSYVEKGDKAAKKAVTVETIKEMAPVITPVVVMGAATTACILGSNSISSKRIAVLSAAYSISERTVKDLNGKMNEVLGVKKTQVIKDAIAKDKLDASKTPKGNQVIVTGNGDVLCKDSYTGRFFQSNAQKIGQAINELSHDLMTDMYVSLNDFYGALNIPRVPMGEDLGWNVDDTQRGQLPITYTAILTESGEPCLCVEYDVGVRTDYRNLH